jgi:hypothetical protein
MMEKPILIRHLGSNHHIWLLWQDLTPGFIADQYKNSLQKTDCKTVCKIRSDANFIFGGHFVFLTPSCMRQKIFYEFVSH